MSEECQITARRLNLPLAGVRAVVELLDEGATVPFISRYRKERTGRLDEVAVRNIETTLEQVRKFIERREFVRQAIVEAGAMTEAIAGRLEKAETLTDLEDIYAPFKPKRRTRAQMARERGLEPLAKIIMAGRSRDLGQTARRFIGKEVENEEAALAGASDIIAEWASESVRLRNILRRAYRRNALLESSPVKDKEEELKETQFADYAQYSRPATHCPAHIYLALRRGEAQGFLRVRFKLQHEDEITEDLCHAFVPQGVTKECAVLISEAVRDASSRLLRPSVETELAAELKAKADHTSIEIFSDNLHRLLMAPPLRGRRILAIDPGFRTGCKVVALDENGNLLDEDVIFPTPPRNDYDGAVKILKRLISKHRLDAVALGNATASRETRAFLEKAGLLPEEAVFVVSESGASVYSASEVARKEFPDHDVTVRGAVSIGRRLIDPLAELVKIDPKAIGVGQYQHDVDQDALKEALDFEVLSCVNAVGVDVNTASEQLLSYVSGIGPALAGNIVKNRLSEGRFASREDLKRVPRLGAKAFELSAGFLRIPDGDNRLDDTPVHPESYGLVKRMAKSLGVAVEKLPGNLAVLDGIDTAELAISLGIARETVEDLVADLRRPGRDPRLDDDTATVFVPSVKTFEDVTPGRTLSGVVKNVTAFGAFVDLGIKVDGLIHSSRLPKGRRIGVGSKVEVLVESVDRIRKRISLTLIE